jgi:hypothetical protein
VEEVELTINNLVTADGEVFSGFYTRPASQSQPIPGDGRDLIPIVFGRPSALDLFVRWVGADGGTASDKHGSGWATDMSIRPGSTPQGFPAEQGNITDDFYWRSITNELYYLRRTSALPPQTTDVTNPGRKVSEDATRIFAGFSMPVQPGQGSFSLSEFDRPGTPNAWGEMTTDGPFTLRSLTGTGATPGTIGNQSDLRAFLTAMGFTPLAAGGAITEAMRLDAAIVLLRTAWNCVCMTMVGVFPAGHDCIMYIEIDPAVNALERGGLYNVHITQFRSVLDHDADVNGMAVNANDYVWLYENNPHRAVPRVYFTHTFQAEGEDVPEKPLEIAQIWLSTTEDFLNDFVRGNARLIYTNDLTENGEQRFVDSAFYGARDVNLLNLHMLLDEDVIANNFLTVIFNRPVVPDWGTVGMNYENLIFLEDEGNWFPVPSNVFGLATDSAGAPANPLTARTWGDGINDGYHYLGAGSFALDLVLQADMTGLIPWVNNDAARTDTSATVARPVTTAPWNHANFATPVLRKYGYNAVQFDLLLFEAKNRDINQGEVFTTEFFPAVAYMDSAVRTITNDRVARFATTPTKTYVGYTHRPYSIPSVDVIVTGYVCAMYWAANHADYIRNNAMWPSDAQEARHAEGFFAIGREVESFSIQDDPVPTVLAWGVFDETAATVMGTGAGHLGNQALRRSGDASTLIGSLTPALTPNATIANTVRGAGRVVTPATPAVLAHTTCRWIGYGINLTVDSLGLTGPAMQARWENSTSVRANPGQTITFPNYAVPVLDLDVLTGNTGSVIIWFTEIVHPANNALFPGTGGGGGIEGLLGITVDHGMTATANWFHDWQLNGDERFMVSVVVIDIEIDTPSLPVTAGNRFGTINVHEYPELVAFGTTGATVMDRIWRANVERPQSPLTHTRHSGEVPLLFRVDVVSSISITVPTQEPVDTAAMEDHIVIGSLTAPTVGQEGGNPTRVFSLDGGPDDALFKINPDTGQVQVDDDDLFLMNPGVYQIRVRVEYSDDNGMAATNTLYIDITVTQNLAQLAEDIIANDQDIIDALGELEINTDFMQAINDVLGIASMGDFEDFIEELILDLIEGNIPVAAVEAVKEMFEELEAALPAFLATRAAGEGNSMYSAGLLDDLQNVLKTLVTPGGSWLIGELGDELADLMSELFTSVTAGDRGSLLPWLVMSNVEMVADVIEQGGGSGKTAETTALYDFLEMLHDSFDGGYLIDLLDAIIEAAVNNIP